jgi:probable addiction module antidote protein
VKVKPFDPAEHLETEEDILHYLKASMEGNDARHVARALGDVAHSKGMSEIARKSGLGGRPSTTPCPRKVIPRSKP